MKLLQTSMLYVIRSESSITTAFLHLSAALIFTNCSYCWMPRLQSGATDTWSSEKISGLLSRTFSLNLMLPQNADIILSDSHTCCVLKEQCVLDESMCSTYFSSYEVCVWRVHSFSQTCLTESTNTCSHPLSALMSFSPFVENSLLERNNQLNPKKNADLLISMSCHHQSPGIAQS